LRGNILCSQASKKIGSHARFSETLLSSLWASLYDYAIAKTQVKEHNYCWALIAFYYATEHAVNTLLIMLASPSLFEEPLDIWNSGRSSLNSLKKHRNKIFFLKGYLNINGFEDVHREYYKTLCNLIGKDRVERIGMILDLLYELRLLHNYEGLIIAHHRREDIETMEYIPKIAKMSCNVAQHAIATIVNAFLKWFKDELLKPLLKEEYFLSKALATAHIHHLIQELDQFKRQARGLRHYLREYLAKLDQTIEECKKLVEYDKSIKDYKYEKIVESFIKQTHVSSFRHKRDVYQQIRYLYSSLIEAAGDRRKQKSIESRALKLKKATR